MRRTMILGLVSVLWGCSPGGGGGSSLGSTGGSTGSSSGGGSGGGSTGSSSGGGSGGSGGGSGGSGGSTAGSSCSGSCADLAGSWKVTQVTCNGSTVPYLTPEYTAPNSIVFTFPCPMTSTTQQAVQNGCTLTQLASFTCKGSGAFSIPALTGSPTCSPSGCSQTCATPAQQPQIDYTYALSGNTLTLTSSDSTFCTSSSQPVSITASKL